ncbi:MAG: SDR family oxidoreductase [Chloroflexota bacterium]|nr:MAG: SDR family oxidoreductase [Chloroflexota bacterium]
MDAVNLPVGNLLAGQHALVTGGARGIGRAVALHLAQAGADVTVADLRPEDVESTARAVRQFGRRATAVGADVATDAGRRAIVEAANSGIGSIDILVNNAGIIQIVEPFAMTEADWDRMLGINAKAVFFLSQLVLPGMVERRRGSVISLASMAGKAATGVNSLHYNVSKAAVIAMTKTLAHAVAKSGVRVNCVCPGIIDTEMWRQIDREQGQRILGLAEGALIDQRIAQVPLGRAGTPEDVARVILFLASPLADYMTGQAINITGGTITY